MDNSLPVDHLTRERFIVATDINHSLVCPAGSGKTHSIVGRVKSLAQRPDAEDVLRRLVLVTFTKKAAEEMQVRARESLDAAGVSGAVRGAFNQAYFGTIHAFAVLLLQTYGHHIGVPSSFEVSMNDDLTWARFLREWSGQENLWSDPRAKRIVRNVSLHEILKLARKWDFARPVTERADAPAYNFAPIYDFPQPKRQDTARNIAAFQKALRKWEKAWVAGNDDSFLAMPVPEKGGKEFLSTALNALGPVRKWLNEEAAWLASEIAAAYQKYRIAAGVLTFSDQLNLAVKLVRHPVAIDEIRKRGFRVILDEAQDTDPEQFEILLEVVRPLGASGKWSEGKDGPEGGRFTMVGDPQQSIYRARADLETYRRAHDYIVSNNGESLSYEVTFRCDEAIIETANRWFPSLLDGQGGQVKFVHLTHRPNAGAGQVVRLDIPYADENPEYAEAVEIARFLSDAGLEKLRARSWGEVAILCPRKRWFGALKHALAQRGLRCQLLSSRDRYADSTAFAWFTAVAVVMADPFNAFEIVGVLREVFGVSDHDLAFFARGEGERFQIVRPIEGEGPVFGALNTLRVLRERAVKLPVAEAAQLIDDELLGARIDVLFPNDETEASYRKMAIAIAAEIGASRGTLSDWASKLEELLEQASEEPGRDPHAISIVTNLKSKGLEWDAVIVPFLFREITDKSEEYPRLMGSRSEVTRAAFAKADVVKDDIDEEEIASRHELARIAYVTLTRARRTLVLVNDRESFGQIGAVAFSMGGSLGLCFDNETSFLSLPTELIADDSINQTAPASNPDAQLLAVDIDDARRKAAEFPHQLTPHRLAMSFTKDEPEVRLYLQREDAAQTEGRDYGIWWHDLMRDMPWGAGREKWNEFFSRSLAACPNVERAHDEWDIFIRSPLADRLSSPGAVVQTEVPFHAPLNGGEILEGVIDLMLSNDGKLEVVDWKASGHKPEEILTIYKGQLDAYVSAVAGITDVPVTGTFYHTAFGEIAA